MKKIVSLLIILGILIMPQTVFAAKKVLRHAGGGAAIGAIAGSTGGEAGKGALIGGGVGLLTGALASKKEKEKQQQQQRELQDAYAQGRKDAMTGPATDNWRP